jgi:AAA domain/Bifunctional DNA primase/polymerase, N-terminal
MMRDPSDTLTALRLRLRANGYHPLPCEGKAPPLTGWQTKFDSNEAEIRLWDRTWHLATNTGLLTKFTPALDIDITDPAAAEAVEALAREHFEERGNFMVRTGQAPKRCIPLRTDEPFGKLARIFTAPNGGEHKIEILSNGQQVVAFGIHPTTQQPYRWHGGSPADTAREDLPYVRESDAGAFLDAAATLLIEQFNFTETGGSKKTTDNGGEEPRDAFDWGQAFTRILTGTNLHDTITAVAASFIATGMSNAAAIERLRSLMTASQAPKDARWRERYNEIPRAVTSARAKFGAVGDRAQTKTTAPVGITMETLKMMTFPPLKYVVPEILVEGLTLLAGKPKVGKSWLLLHAAIAVARGGFTLGTLHCIEGDVLYCALEDSPRRMQSRGTKLLGINNEWPRRMTVYYNLPRLGAGGANIIRGWVQTQPQPRLIVVDTLAMIRSLKKPDSSDYQSDYLALIELRDLAIEFNIAIAVVQHLRKAESDDVYDTISGTLGLTGAVDTVLVLKGDRWSGYTLHGKGRDLEEIEKAVTFDKPACTWRIEGEAAAVRRSGERQTVLDAITEAKQPIGPNDIAIATRMKPGNVRFLLYKLAQEGVIESPAYGRYRMKGTSEPPAEGSFRVIGECQEQTICVACGQPGDVKRITPVGQPGTKSETLHEACAPAWFARV